MIIDRIENSGLYLNLGNRIARAFNYINSTDFSKTEPGKYEIDSDNIFAVVNEYETKDIKDCALEAHRKYIDIQYMYSGAELIGVAPLVNQTPVKEYSEEKDCVFFNEETSLVKMTGGMFAIFFPGDLHMPGVKADGPSKVKKIVVKVRI
ncbi:MAG: YhcH/YjgK/YiaL family protein [Bacteroidales bacterium]|nr:MAG: YhcH/YjgK/YiaL family protein [Bacteroidales bacterium]